MADLPPPADVAQYAAAINSIRSDIWLLAGIAGLVWVIYLGFGRWLRHRSESERREREDARMKAEQALKQERSQRLTDTLNEVAKFMAIAGTTMRTLEQTIERSKTQLESKLGEIGASVQALRDAHNGQVPREVSITIIEQTFHHAIRPSIHIIAAESLRRNHYEENKEGIRRRVMNEISGLLATSKHYLESLNLGVEVAPYFPSYESSEGNDIYSFCENLWADVIEPLYSKFNPAPGAGDGERLRLFGEKIAELKVGLETSFSAMLTRTAKSSGFHPQP